MTDIATQAKAAYTPTLFDSVDGIAFNEIGEILEGTLKVPKREKVMIDVRTNTSPSGYLERVASRAKTLGEVPFTVNLVQGNAAQARLNTYFSDVSGTYATTPPWWKVTLSDGSSTIFRGTVKSIEPKAEKDATNQWDIVLSPTQGHQVGSTVI